MLGLPNIQNFVYILVGSLVHVRYNLANMSIQLSNQPHDTVKMVRMDLVYILVFRSQSLVVLRMIFMHMGKNIFIQKKRIEKKEKEKKGNT